MSNKLVEHIDQLVSETSWPTGAAVGGESQQTYETGVDLLHTYRGDPADLRDALRLFQQCGSAPYARAGIGYVLVLASYENGDDYDADGLRLAGEWLDRARSAAPGRVEIEFLGALIPVLSGRLRGTPGPGPPRNRVSGALLHQHHRDVLLVRDR